MPEEYDFLTEYAGLDCLLRIWDTKGHEEWNSHRPVAYNDADVFVVCFDLSDRRSLECAGKRWKKELNDLGPRNVPKVLVGCKKDKRDHMILEGDKGEKKSAVTAEQGQEYCDKNKFFGYVECSVTENLSTNSVYYQRKYDPTEDEDENLDKVFQEAIHAV